MSSALPEKLISALKTWEHFNEEAFLSVHASGEQLVSVHMNPQKRLFQNGHWKENISDPPFEIAQNIPWATDAYYLSERPSFTLDPLFHAGTYYVQEASGMFLEYALRRTVDLSRSLKMLDLCAAPGGKSTMIQSLVSPESLLVSNEVIKSRVPVLYQNMTKWGFTNGIISNNDPVHFKSLPGFFDVLMMDAPCSGSGLFRKDPEAAKEWSPDAVKLCSQRQQRILGDAWDCLKENGILIYSTCSYSKEENEDILDHVLQQYEGASVSLSPDPAWNIMETFSEIKGAAGYRFYPDKLSGEGFFLAVIQKKQAANPLRINKSKRNPDHIPKWVEIQIREWIQAENLTMIQVGDSIHALPSVLINDFEILKNHLYLKKAGIRMGKSGAKEWVPDHELALSNILPADIPSLDLSKEDIQHYLRAENFETACQNRGWHAVSYLQQRIGWVKMLESRMNNYYPKSWRIRF